MHKTKLLLTLVLAFAFLFAQVGNVAAAAPLQTSTTLDGTVQSISSQTDTGGNTVIVVTLTDTQGTTHTVTLSEADAVTLSLISVDSGTGAITFLVTSGATVQIPTANIISDTTTTQEPVNPISSLLGAFFGVDASKIDMWHSENHFGFGVIAQALWMAKNLTTDTTTFTFDQILTAKQSGDYSAFFPPDATDIPTNWGQFKKDVLSDKHNNLGNVVSGHANDQSQPGQGNNQNNGKGQDNTNNGQGKNNGKGHNKP